MPWTDDVPEPERDLDELRDVVAAKAGRLRTRRRLGLVSGAAALVAVLVMLAALPGGDAKPRRLQAANRPDTSTTVDPSSDDTIDPSEVYGEEPTTTVPGQTTSTTAKRKAGTASPATTAPPPPCGTPSVRLSPSETSGALVGAWVRCRGGSQFWKNEAGIEIRADGRWTSLVAVQRDPTTPPLSRMSGWGANGDWAAIQAQQVNFDIDGRGTVIVHASFTQDRSTVHLDGMGGAADYVRLPSGTPFDEAQQSTGDECGNDEGRERSVTSESEFRTAITHVWLLCQPEWFFAEEAAGLEIRPDGGWSLLDRRNDGVLVRGRSGTWTVIDSSSMNGPGHYQLTFESNGGNSAYATFATRTSKMRLDGMGGTFDHVHAPAGTQVVDG